MGPANQIEVEFVQKQIDNVRPEYKRDSSLVLLPSSNIELRIAPEQIA